MILENLGWNIHRIWSTDWFKNRDREIDRLVNRIKELVVKEEREAASRRAMDQILALDYGENIPEELADVATVAPASRQLALFELRRQEVRKQLTELRDLAMAEFPEVPPERQLLRDQMMQLFLQRLPRTRSEWFDKVPLSLREGTDLLQMRKYLPKVLDLISQVVD